MSDPSALISRGIYLHLEEVNAQLTTLRDEIRMRPDDRNTLQAKLTDWRLVAGRLAIDFGKAATGPEDAESVRSRLLKFEQIDREVVELKQEIDLVMGGDGK